LSEDATMPTLLRFRVNPVDASSAATLELPSIDGETVGALKARVSPLAGPDASFFVLQANGRPLKLVEVVVDELFDIAWNRCSHGAPAHPITGESPCFWDGGPSSGDVEY
jgi:hypothetical protein